MRSKSLAPLKWRVSGPGPSHRVVWIRQRPSDLVQMLQHLVGRRLKAVDLLHQIVGSVQPALEAGAIIASDIDDEGVVELTGLAKCVDHPSDFVIGLGHESSEH